MLMTPLNFFSGLLLAKEAHSMQDSAYLYSFTTCLSLCLHLHLRFKLLLFIYSSLNMLWLFCFPDLALVASSVFFPPLPSSSSWNSRCLFILPQPTWMEHPFYEIPTISCPQHSTYTVFSLPSPLANIQRMPTTCQALCYVPYMHYLI